MVLFDFICSGNVRPRIISSNIVIFSDISLAIFLFDMGALDKVIEICFEIR